jgi:RNA polymerase sigma factor (sigma-70 family)
LSSNDIARLYRLEARSMTGFFVARTHDPEVAVDLVGETFAMVVRDRDEFRGAGDTAALAWIYAIARNLLAGWYRRGAIELRALKRLGIERPDLDPVEHDRLIELGGLAAERQRVAQRLLELPEQQRAAVQLRVVDERPYAEVGHTLGISEQTARARVSRGLRALAAQLSEVPSHG